MSGYFQPLEITPLRVDFLVVDAVPGNRSAAAQIPC
jgi:hypothetical protein